MSVENTDCFICRKHRGEIDEPGGALYDDGLVRVGHAGTFPGGPLPYLGYLFVESKRHVAGLADLTEYEAASLGRVLRLFSRALVGEGAEHVYSFILGDHIAHLHVHLVPRYPGAPREYWGVRVDQWPDAPRGDATTVGALCDRLRARIVDES